jgi:phosphoheptose isomerase
LPVDTRDPATGGTLFFAGTAAAADAQHIAAEYVVRHQQKRPAWRRLP